MVLDASGVGLGRVEKGCAEHDVSASFGLSFADKGGSGVQEAHSAVLRSKKREEMSENGEVGFASVFSSSSYFRKVGSRVYMCL